MDQLDLFADPSAFSDSLAVGNTATGAQVAASVAASAEAGPTAEHHLDRADDPRVEAGELQEFEFQGKIIWLPTMTWEESAALGELARELGRPVSVYDLRARRAAAGARPKDAVEPEEAAAVDDVDEGTGDLVLHARCTGWYPGYPGPDTIAVVSQPCWKLCGHGAPPPGCHPGRFYGAEPPLIPCLACRRTMRSCEADLWCCPQPAPCGQVWADAIAGDPGWKLAERYLDRGAVDDAGERAAIMIEDGGKPPQVAWRDAFWATYRALRKDCEATV